MEMEKGLRPRCTGQPLASSGVRLICTSFFLLHSRNTITGINVSDSALILDVEHLDDAPTSLQKIQMTSYLTLGPQTVVWQKPATTRSFASAAVIRTIRLSREPVHGETFIELGQPWWMPSIAGVTMMQEGSRETTAGLLPGALRAYYRS